MTIADKIAELTSVREAIREAIVAKGGTLPAGSDMSAYPNAVSDLPASGEKVVVAYSSMGPTTSNTSRFMKSAQSAITSLDGFDIQLGNVTSMSYMFKSCSSLTEVPEMDTSKVTDMSYMFSGCSSLTEVPEMDTSNVTNMGEVFSGCSSLTEVPEMDTSNVTNMSYMFSGCSSLTEVPEMDTSNVMNMGDMFRSCSSLTSIGIYGFTRSISISGCKLDTDALNALFTQAGTAYNASQSINITGNPGAATCDRSSATAKGWTVTG